MALGLIFGGSGAGDGESLFSAFTKINNMFTTTTLLSGGDLTINDVRVGRGLGNIVTNTALGNSALNSNTTGNTNTAVGVGALEKNQNGNLNTAVGNYALERNISGSLNTALGSSALYNNQTQNYNTAIGNGALSANTLWTNCTGLGYDSQVSADNQVRIGNSNVTAVISQVGSWSDIRDKADIRDTVLGLDFINSLRAVDYKWDFREDYKSEMPSPLTKDATQEEINAHKIIMDEWLESCKFSNLVHDGSKKRTRYHHGLIAQEVKSVIEASGVDFGGFQDHTIGGGDEVMTISYMELITPMIKAIQELTARINVLEGN